MTGRVGRRAVASKSIDLKTAFMLKRIFSSILSARGLKSDLKE